MGKCEIISIFEDKFLCRSYETLKEKWINKSSVYPKDYDKIKIGNYVLVEKNNIDHKSLSSNEKFFVLTFGDN